MSGNWIAVYSLFVVSSLCAAAEPIGAHNPSVPELEVLERMAGTWEASFGGSDEVIRSTRIWVLDGRFLKHEFAVSNGALRGIIYRGYDQKNARYTLTFLDSQGNVSLLAGHWDAEQKTLRLDAVDSSCPVRRYESSFLDDSTEQWTIQIQGDELTEVSGVAKKIP
ncbi:MAG: DUF1579 family protein [Planctomycetaceae bacterium]|nr:DUF1579 family protein [Planctomycetaceae bacterium]